MQRYDDLEREVRSLHEAVAARLTVASIYSVGLAHMSGCLREFLAAHPQADVRLEYLHPHRVYEAVDSGQADLGLVSYPEESASLAAIAVADRADGAGVLSAASARRAAQRAARACCAASRSWRFKTGLKIREEIDRVLALHKVSRRAWRWSSTTSKRSSGRSKSAPASACCRSRRSRARSKPARWCRFRSKASRSCGRWASFIAATAS